MAGTLVANTINTDTGLFSTNNAYTGICKAWVNFAGSSGTVNGSFNVSSVTRTTTGTYTINLTTAMANSNYSIATCGSTASGQGDSLVSVIDSNFGTAPTTTAFQLFCRIPSSGALLDATYVYAQVFSS
jgi:hypothetical protein